MFGSKFGDLNLFHCLRHTRTYALYCYIGTTPVPSISPPLCSCSSWVICLLLFLHLSAMQVAARIRVNSYLTIILLTILWYSFSKLHQAWVRGSIINIFNPLNTIWFITYKHCIIFLTYDRLFVIYFT